MLLSTAMTVKEAQKMYKAARVLLPKFEVKFAGNFEEVGGGELWRLNPSTVQFVGFGRTWVTVWIEGDTQLTKIRPMLDSDEPGKIQFYLGA
jgi:hypothetical protein